MTVSLYFLYTLQSSDESSASDDIKNVDLTKVHNLSGPITVEGAEPGDCLVVDILNSERASLLKILTCPWCYLVMPFEKMPWGYTVKLQSFYLLFHTDSLHRAYLSLRMEGVFLVKLRLLLFFSFRTLTVFNQREFNSKAAKAIWDLNGNFTASPTANSKLSNRSGIHATSRHIPGVRFAGVTHPGLIGTAPSAKLLAEETIRTSPSNWCVQILRIVVSFSHWSMSVAQRASQQLQPSPILSETAS
jgi:formamidase